LFLSITAEESPKLPTINLLFSIKLIKQVVPSLSPLAFAIEQNSESSYLKTTENVTKEMQRLPCLRVWQGSFSKFL